MNNLVVEFLASFLIYFLFFGLAILWVVDGKIKKEQVLHALLATVIAWGITAIIKLMFPTLRPFKTDGLPPLTFTIPGDSSFPSGHSAEAFALAVTVWLHDRKVGWVFLGVALVVALARVWANVHYPIDIAVGALIGTTVALIVERTHLSNFLASKRRK